MDAQTRVFDPLDELTKVFGEHTTEVLNAAVTLSAFVNAYRDVLRSRYPAGVRFAGIELLPDDREKMVALTAGEMARRNAEKAMRETAIAQLFPRKPSFPTVDLGTPACVNDTCKFEPEGCDCHRVQCQT